MGLEAGAIFLGGGGGPIPGMMGLERGLFGVGVWGARRKGGRICCIIWCSMKKGSGTGPRLVITMGGLPGGTPMCGGGRGTGGGRVGLSCGLGPGVEILAVELMAADSDGDMDPDGPGA